MNRRKLLFGFGMLGAMGLTTGGTVYALNTLGLAPKPVIPPEPDPHQATRPGADKTSGTHDSPASGSSAPGDHPAAGAVDEHPAASGAPHWGYDGDTGPEAWSELDPANALCKLGGAQSPIDLVNPMRVAALAGLQTNYKSTQLKVTNNGHTLQVNVDKGSSLKVDGKTFDLLQFHFHTPSEHTVDGKTFPLELHMVHQAQSDKSLAVVGILLTEGASNIALGRFWDKMPRSVGEVDAGGSLELKELLPRDIDEYFTYSGSLTTPPCTESVRWIVLKQPMTLSKNQITTFRAVFPMNARPTMPLGSRYILSS
jgi:carbonic anhydrase